MVCSDFCVLLTPFGPSATNPQLPIYAPLPFDVLAQRAGISLESDAQRSTERQTQMYRVPDIPAHALRG